MFVCCFFLDWGTPQMLMHTYRPVIVCVNAEVCVCVCVCVCMCVCVCACVCMCVCVYVHVCSVLYIHVIGKIERGRGGEGGGGCMELGGALLKREEKETWNASSCLEAEKKYSLVLYLTSCAHIQKLATCGACSVNTLHDDADSDDEEKEKDGHDGDDDEVDEEEEDDDDDDMMMMMMMMMMRRRRRRRWRRRMLMTMMMTLELRVMRLYDDKDDNHSYCYSLLLWR